MAIIPERPENTFDPNVDWKETYDTVRPSGAAAIGTDRLEDALEIVIPFNKVVSAAQKILGYSTASDDGRTMNRFLPYQHPYLPWLWATDFSFTPFNPLALNPGQTNYADGSTTQTLQQGPLAGPGVLPPTLGPVGGNPPQFVINNGVPVAGALQSQIVDKPIASAKMPIGSFSSGPPYFYMNYTRAKCIVRFAPVTYPILDDSKILGPDGQPAEYMRFFGLNELEPTLDLITMEGTTNGQFYYAETDYPGNATGPTPVGTRGSSAGATPNRSFPGAVYIRKQTTKYQMLWKGVAEKYVCAGSQGQMPYPAALINGLGYINSDVTTPPTVGATGNFLGHLNDTLLYESLKGKRYQLPFNTDDKLGAWSWDFILTFQRFDPPRPPAVTQIISPTPPPPPPPPPPPLPPRRRGHVTFPWRQNGYFYYATKGDDASAGAYSGQPALNAIDFKWLFSSPANPLNPLGTTLYI